MNLLHFRYTSDALGRNTAAYILVPEKVKGPMKVMFLLHGLWGDYSDWQRKSSIERYIGDLNLMVVMPDGGRGFYVDAPEGDRFGTAVGEELPNIVESYFNVDPSFCVTGLSMGGYGAVRLALYYPHRFVSAVSHSGAFYVGGAEESADPEIAKMIRRLVGANPEGGPTDIEHLATSVEATRRPKLRIDCGVDDHLIQKNRRLHAFLNKIGYEHEYDEFAGSHTWEYWDAHVPQAIAFHRHVLSF